MSTPTQTSSELPAEILDTHLKAELENRERIWTFDMKDEQEASVLAPFDRLKQGLDFLQKSLGESYSDSDKRAIRHHEKHHTLARWAIVLGSGAVALAILQLGVAQLLPNGAKIAFVLEIVAVVSGYFAVRTGLKARHDDQWFVQRHRAERLRMLKFRSLGSRKLWCETFESWQSWVNEQKADIESTASREDVEKYVGLKEKAEPLEDNATHCIESPATIHALASYYRRKRVDFQAAYFRRQSAKNEILSKPFHELGLKFFFGSIIAVMVHFVCDVVPFVTGHGAATGHLTSILHGVGIVALMVAALMPVASLCIRAWQGAFEHSRSAAIFEAKQHALEHSSQDLANSRDSLNDTMHHIAHIEHFLDQEHREWLRLMLDTEWFL